MGLGTLPAVTVTPDPVVMAGGLDLVTAPLLAKPGTLRLAYNYEIAVGGGYTRAWGIDRFDGRPRPSDAEYILLLLDAPAVSVFPGDTLTGATSAATGRVIYAEGASVAVTRVSGVFTTEVVQVAAVDVGTVIDTEPPVDGFLDNTLMALAANDYRLDILAVPGTGRIRGLAILNDRLYAWRDNVGGTATVIHKSTPSGWNAVEMLHLISFTDGTDSYEVGDTITQGANSAIVRRIVVDEGIWTSGTGKAAGRMLIEAPTPGAFIAGPAAGGGVVVLVGASAPLALLPGGRVRTVAYTFTAALEDKRLYGCDGVNPEFEFDGDTWMPILTGMEPIRAQAVCCHKQHLFYGYRGSLQHSGIGAPHSWTPLFGAAELSTGDDIADLISFSGSEASAALMVLCKNAALVLYGSSEEDWNLVTLSRVAGCSPGSAQDVGGVLALDTPGFVRYRPTQAFGNYLWDTASLLIDPIARMRAAECSVFAAPRNVYRCFFADGTAVSGFPSGKGVQWTTIDYGRLIVAAVHDEINGIPHTFYGDDNGFVYEADVGRCLDGEVMQWGLRLSELSQRSPVALKQYRRVEIELQAGSATTLRYGAEFADANEEIDSATQVIAPLYGSGLYFDLSQLDYSYWGVPGVGRQRLPIEGQGTSIAPTVGGESDNELPHTLRAMTVMHTIRRIAR